MAVVFEVEQAGCASCAERVRSALEDFAPVTEVAIDESSDSATVTLAADTTASEDEVNEALAGASHGSGHMYRVRPGSWRVAD